MLDADLLVIVTSVILITAQRLARRLCSCKQPLEIGREALLAADRTIAGMSLCTAAYQA